MNPSILGQVLGGIFASTLRRRGGPGATTIGGGLGTAAIGSILAGMLGRRSGGRGAVVAMLLPYVLQWVQRNGGLRAVLGHMRQRGLGPKASSWVSTGENDVLDAQDVESVVGNEEISRLSQQLGVPQEEVKEGFAEILPEMVNQLTPDGQVRAEADEVLAESIPLLEQELVQARRESGQPA